MGTDGDGARPWSHASDACWSTMGRLHGLGLNIGSRRSSDASGSFSLGLLLRDNRGGELISITDVDAKALNVNVAVTPEEYSSEDDLGSKIENTVGDSLRIWGNDVPTFGNTPDDGVDQGDGNGPDGKNVVQAEDIGTESTSISTAFIKDGIGDKEECSNTECEEACGLQMLVSQILDEMQKYVPHLYVDLTKAPTRRVITKTWLIRMVYQIVGVGRPAVNRRSANKRGVVIK